MRKILSFVFFLATFFIVEAQQNAEIKFVDPEVIGAKYRIGIRIYRTPGQTWKLGSSNLRLNYPNLVIQNPTVVAASNSFVNSNAGFNTPNWTATNTSTGLISYNVVLGNTATGGLTFPAGDSLNLLTFEFDILNSAGLLLPANQLVWRTTATVGSANPKLALVSAAPVQAITVNSSPSFSPLPIELLSFTGKDKEEVNTFRWDVASQANVSHFVIERSIDGVNNFREVTERVKAAGTTNKLMVYTAEDKNPINLGYYRLKSVDFDGSTSYSNVISIDRRNTKFGVIDLSPNPTSDVVRINFESNTRGDIEFTVTDITGRIVKTQSTFATIGNNSFTIEMAELTNGTYFISMTDGKNTTVQKVVKQ